MYSTTQSLVLMAIFAVTIFDSLIRFSAIFNAFDVMLYLIYKFAAFVISPELFTTYLDIFGNWQIHDFCSYIL